MSLIRKENYDATNRWYTNGVRVVWWDRSTKNWITYIVSDGKYQQGPADYHPNKASFQECEALGHYNVLNDRDELRELLN